VRLLSSRALPKGLHCTKDLVSSAFVQITQTYNIVMFVKMAKFQEIDPFQEAHVEPQIFSSFLSSMHLNVTIFAL